MSNRFHLALPSGDLKIAKEFYCGLLGCKQGNEEINDQDSWVDINFWGNELTLHATESIERLPVVRHHVDYGDVDVPHFGVHLSSEDFAALKAKLLAANIDFLNEPFVRFAGGEQEQETMFFADPNGNVLEIKSMKNPDMMWEFTGNQTMKNKVDIQEVLETKMESYDFEESLTLREYLKMLLTELWIQGESFSGKRPLGNSGWQYDVYGALVKGGYIKGTLDENDYVNEVDTKEANKLVLECIEGL